jgi:hypothetical protein
MAPRTVGASPINYACNTHTQIYEKEVAQNFKEQGNEYFRGKRYREALGFYSQGVDAKPDDVQLKEALLLNRAACNLELGMSHYFSTILLWLICEAVRKSRIGIARLCGCHYSQCSCVQSLLPCGTRPTRT